MQQVADNPPPMLASHCQFRTAELDEARHLVARNFCGHRLERQSRSDRFDACQHRAGGDGLYFNYIRYGADVEIEPGELGSFYLIQVPLVGHAEVRNGCHDVVTGVGVASVLNPDRHTRMRWHAGCEQMLLQVDRDRMQTVAEQIAGHPLTVPVRFAPRVDARKGALQTWVRDLRTAIQAVDRCDLLSAGQVLSRALVEDALIAGFLRHQPSNISPLLDGPRAQAPSIHVRRAVDYMQAHLAEPITLSLVAAATGTSERTLQLGFRSSFGMTPLEYLREQRLNLARFLLLERPAHESVSHIAGSAGFAHLGRFSAHYSARFGENPSATRKRRQVH